MALPRDGNKYELHDGALVVSPAGMEHGHVSLRISTALSMHVAANKAGAVFDSSTGFRMKSGDVLSPDVSFVNKARLRGVDRLPDQFFEGAPDLVVEVLSPRQSLAYAQDKLREYFANGTRLCWVVDPQAKQVWVYEPELAARRCRKQDALAGGAVLPGFTLPVSDMFAPTWK